MAKPLSDFGRVLSTIFRFARYASYCLTGFMLVFLAFRVAELYRWFADMHPIAGIAFLVVFGAAFFWFIGRPVYRFLKMPVVIRPPNLPPAGERTGKDLVRHLAFVERYLKHLTRNPSWQGSPTDVENVIARCQALAQRAQGADAESVEALSEEIRALEREDVNRLLAPLDQEVSNLIRREALGVGVATAVSWNGTVDAFIVLWRNCNLVSRIARIYYGRPGVRGTLSILRDVSGATLAGAYMQDLSEMAGSALGTVFGKSFGVLAGPVMEGGLNAVATLRIGYVAKARCRAFSAWTERTRVDALKGALTEAGQFSKTVFTEVVKTVGGGIFKIPATAVGKVADSIGKFWSRLGRDEPEPEPGTA